MSSDGAAAADRVPRVLAADDDPDVLAALKLLLKAEGFELETATSPALALAALESRDFDAALLDLNYARDTTSGREGLELVERLRALDPTLPVVVMTAWGSVEGAVAAVRRGAREAILATGGASGEGFDAALQSLAEWGGRRDATFWFTVSWAEAVKA